MYVFYVLHGSVSVCQQDHARTELICTKLVGRTVHGPGKNPLDFGADLDNLFRIRIFSSEV